MIEEIDASNQCISLSNGSILYVGDSQGGMTDEIMKFQIRKTIEEHRDKEDSAFDLILTDIEMPQMDGLHLTSKIKSDAKLKDIPVVLFSSLITKDNFQKGVSVGADAQVSKPDSDGMIKAIESCLMKKETPVTA